ncbi:MAG: hypothetical protein HOC71_14910, partial [Candidatus Latescibacteria bacterium]|nr:hypothetical protein [Candidatus Latescibacterota bacterium]
ILIENPAELNLEELSQYTDIGVTAGASTPNWVLKQVVDSIAGYTPHVHRSFYGLLMSLAYFVIEGNFVICAAAAALTYSMCKIMSIPPYPLFPLMTFFYLFPLHTVNKYLEINWKQVSSSPLASRFRMYWKIYLITGSVFFVILLGIAWYLSILTFILVVLSYIFGGFYSIHIIPEKWNIGFKSLRDIPGSKDIFIALAWTFAVIVLPSITLMKFPGVVAITGGAFVIILVLSMTSLLAIGGIQSDKLIGQETIPVLIGRKNTLALLYSANISLMAVIIILSILNPVNRNTLILILPVMYMITCIKFLSKKGQFFTLYHQVILNAVFFLTGILAFLFL